MRMPRRIVGKMSRQIRGAAARGFVSRRESTVVLAHGRGPHRDLGERDLGRPSGSAGSAQGTRHSRTDVPRNGGLDRHDRLRGRSLSRRKDDPVTTRLENPALLLKPEMTGVAKIGCGEARLIDAIRVDYWSWW